MLTAVEERCRQLEAGARKDEQSLLSIRNQLSDATRTLEDSCQKRRETEALLDIRTAELRDAQAALGAPTSHSHGDVQRLVDQLNAEVYQLSALVTDQLPFITKQSIWHGQSHHEEYGQVCSAVGNGLAHALSNCSHDDDPILVQIAVQAYLVERVACIVRAWSLFAEPAYCAVLDRLHTQIFEGESQTVSSGWRLLTRRYMSQADNVDNPIANVLCNFIISGVVAILALAGSPHTTENLRSKIHQAFGGKVGAIVTLAIELRVVIGEEMTSSEFLLLCPKYNVRFDQDFMEDADGEGSRDQCCRSSQGQPILGTVELGLCRYEKKSAENTIENVERRVLMKAKVVLCAMAEELVRHRQQGAANSHVQPSPRDSGGSTTPQENPTRFTFGSLQPAPGDKSSV